MDEVARSRITDVERRVGSLEERTDDIDHKLDGLSGSEQRRKGRVDDIMGVGKVLALLASLGGAVLAWLSYARH
jgi:hypothetical protein